jgi:hypothetical protein
MGENAARRLGDDEAGVERDADCERPAEAGGGVRVAVAMIVVVIVIVGVGMHASASFPDGAMETRPRRARAILERPVFGLNRGGIPESARF